MEELLERLQAFRDARGWRQFHTPKDLAISVCVEAGELLEVFQWRSPDAPVDDSLTISVADEAADVLLYLLLLCDGLGINLAEAAHQKISQNEVRFPVSTSFGVAKPTDQVGVP